MGGKAFGSRQARLTAAAVDDLVTTIRGTSPWDDSGHASEQSRLRAWARHGRRARKAAAAIEELAEHGHRDTLVGLLDHANGHVRADVAAVLLGFHTASHSGRPARWGRADSGALAAVAALWRSPPGRTDSHAARALFALDAAAAVDRFTRELSPSSLDDPGAERRLCDAIYATPDQLGDHAPRWHRALADALTWAPYGLEHVIVCHLETTDLEYLIGALADPLSDEMFDRIMGRIRHLDDPQRGAWLVRAAATAGIDPQRATRLRELAGGGRLPDAPVATIEQVAVAGWDGGPMLLLPGQLAGAWEGADVPSDGRVVDCDYRYDHPDDPATDYDLACESVALDAALIAVGAGHALVTPVSYLALATCDQLDGFFAVIHGEDPLVALWALTSDDAGWRSIGRLATDGVLWIQSAALRGGESGGARVIVPAGTYQLSQLRFSDERGELHIVRGIRA